MRHNPQPQEMYRHFKGNLYQVRCLAKHSETGEMMVVYQAMYGDFQVYVRPLDSFMEEVDTEKYPNAAAKYRFELMSAQDANQMAQTYVDAEREKTTRQEERNVNVSDEAQKLQEEQEELNIDPLVLQFLDADSYERRLEILSMLHSRIDHDMINTMAVAVDVEIKEGDIEDRYEELKNCLLTFAKYECSRLR
ncbi:MAG: DUF1653 domain-containing protein [Bacillus sp. (in: Bacteria)]|nr:DUF1653 domain-containing protein [Bacillus sp. (in: firmicutes)]MCM1426886.1 DUF1653 domain-containing protein [Eubacterium sp.]